MSVAPANEEEEEFVKVEKPRRESMWTRLKRKWKYYGVVEIGSCHRRYELLNCIRKGLQQILSTSAPLAHDSLFDVDTAAEDEVILESSSGKKFTFTSHASSIFALLRHAVGISEKEYQDTLAPNGLPYMQYLSNSKSSADFFLSNDKSYFLKTETLHYVNVFKSFLRDYLRHFIANPHSLIVKIIGLYSIKMAGEKTLHFFVMQSIFFPDNRIKQRYDLKGCLVGRYQKPPKENQSFAVLKDENFKTEMIHLGPQKDWFLTQLRSDTEFLVGLGVLDYSLLIGRQDLVDGDVEQNFGEVVLRTKRSLGGANAKPKHEMTLPPVSDDVTSPSEHLGDNPSSANEQNMSESAQSDVNDNHEMSMSFIVVDNVCDSQNRRLLPRSKNPLHVIDGLHERYYVGIIDFFTLFECRQAVGKVLKTIKYFNSNHSTQTPVKYGERFLNFFTEHTS